MTLIQLLLYYEYEPSLKELGTPHWVTAHVPIACQSVDGEEQHIEHGQIESSISEDRLQDQNDQNPAVSCPSPQKRCTPALNQAGNQTGSWVDPRIPHS